MKLLSNFLHILIVWNVLMSGPESLGVEMWRKRRLELRVGNWVNANENHYEIPSHTHCCCSLSSFWLFATPWTVAHQASLSFTISRSLLKLMSIESVMPSNHLILSCPFSSSSSSNIAQHQGLSQWVGSLCPVAKVLELQHQLPMNIQGWFPLLLTGLISLLSKGLSRVFSNTTVRKY